MERFAAIDIGSNSLLLTIIESDGRGHKILYDEAQVTGLAKNLSANNEIQKSRAEKSQDVLKHYREILNRFNVSNRNLTAVSTEALRRASNGPETKLLLEKSLQAPIELISGNREAELSFLSVQSEFSDIHADKLVFDIGGASTELCLGNSKGIQKRESLKMGSVLITEKYDLAKGPKDPGPCLTGILNILSASSFSKSAGQKALGIGVAGTMTTLLSVYLSIDVYRREAVHLKKITKEEVATSLNNVFSLSLEDRKKITGLPEDRADVFAGGIAIILSLMNFFEWNEIICMDSGVRFGLLYEAIRSMELKSK